MQSQEQVRVIVHAATTWVNPSVTTKLQLLTFFIDILVIAECLFWVGGSMPYNLSLVHEVIRQYQNSQSERERFRAIAGQLFVETGTTVLGYDVHLFRDRLRELAMKYEKVLIDNHFTYLCSLGVDSAHERPA
ncbi:hypothetical protein VNI00_007000 [Paramarasmius palmivorus]|uniref:Uncharacterized protein n=1 Tax=Paramarasmius palmivorus TaxID=297713 RepID=A0AAW0D5E4_9AGAR